MKKIIFILISIVSLFVFVGCSNDAAVSVSHQSDTINNVDNWHGYSVIIVDSCEYIERTETHAKYSRAARQSGYLAHKGNCRFCAKRLENMISNIIQK